MLLVEARHDDGDVLAAKAKAVRQRDLAISFASDVGDVIEITKRIRIFVIDRRRQDFVANRHQANDQFRRASGRNQVPHHAFGAGDGNLPCPFTKHFATGFRFDFVVDRRAGAVRVYVVNLVRR